MIYGDPQLHIDDDRTDRIGLRTLVLSMIWQASRWPMSLLDFDAEKPDVPATSGGLLLIGEQTRRIGGALRTTWTFEGINGDGKSVTFKDRTNSLDYAFEPGFSDRSLLRLPNIQDLLDQFGGYVVDGQVVWPSTITSASNSSSGAVKPDGNAGDPNPLFGYDTYFAIEGTYHFRYMARALSQVPDIGGLIFNDSGQLPGQAPSYKVTGTNPPKGRNWLALTPATRRVGPVFEVTESYWLSGDGGWPTQIYGKAPNSSGADNPLEQ